MPRVVCPVCQKVHNVMPHNMDVLCNCGERQPDTAVTKEDVLKLGFFEDFSGSGGTTNFSLGAENRLQGTKAEIETKITVHDRTPRGNIRSLYRQRDAIRFVEVPKDAK